MRQQQVNDVSTLSSHYRTSAEKEEAEFKLAQKRREAEFKDKQRQSGQSLNNTKNFTPI